MVRYQDLNITQACTDMNLSETADGRWVVPLAAEEMGQSGIGKPMTAEQQRIRQLETENRQLRGDLQILKSIGPLCPGTAMGFEFVEQMRQKATAVNQKCSFRSAVFWRLHAAAIAPPAGAPRPQEV